MRGEERFIDREHLVAEAYKDSKKLDARRQIYRFQTPQLNLPDWILDHVEDPVGRVLDVGCGPGFYLGKLQDRAQTLVGLDLSPGMAAEATNATPLVAVADAQSLPFGDREFDTTLCLHMLYHVPDIDRAIAELRRVTKPKRIVLVVTNGTDHMKGIRESFDRVIQRMTGHLVAPVLSGPRRFRLEDGEEMLSRQFDSVVRDDITAEIAVPEAGPVVRYLESVTSYHEHKLPPGIRWDEVIHEYTREIETIIDREGFFRTPSHAGVFVCS